MLLKESIPEIDEYHYYEYSPYLAGKLGSIEEALFLSYIYFWQSNDEKFVYKSKNHIRKELGLKESRKTTVVKRLKAKGLLDVKVEPTNYAVVTHYRVNIEKLNKLIEDDKRWMNKQENRMKRTWELKKRSA